HCHYCFLAFFISNVKASTKLFNAAISELNPSFSVAISDFKSLTNSLFSCNFCLISTLSPLSSLLVSILLSPLSLSIDLFLFSFQTAINYLPYCLNHYHQNYIV